MLKLHQIRTFAQARTHLEEVCRHRIDLLFREFSERPPLVERKAEPKLGIVFLLRERMKWCVEQARHEGVEIDIKDGRLIGRRV